MPELPEVESTRRRIAPAMVRARINAVDLRRPDLRQPFPRAFARRLTGQKILALNRRAKYLLASLSSGETLLIHLGMSGSFRVLRKVSTGDIGRHDHVVLYLSSGRAVAFNDPRRFGVMDLIPAGELPQHPTLSRLGLEPLSQDFDAAALASACRGKKVSVKAALMDQRVVAGLGNIYASEALHIARLSPMRRASTIATASGKPRDAAVRLVAAIKLVLELAIARQSSSRARDRGSEFRVYDRRDETCARKDCGGVIRRRTQGGRSTFYCPTCQD